MDAEHYGSCMSLYVCVLCGECAHADHEMCRCPQGVFSADE